jgi:hypothetical protein
MAGTVYTVPPIPPDPAHTTYVAAGVLSFGVEYRVLTDADLAANYEGRDLDEVRANVQGTVDDDGVSVHVVGTDEHHEYLRFDLFEQQPHYHYIEPSGRKQTIVQYDAVAMGEMLPWMLRQLRTRLGEMLAHAGGGALLAKLDPAAIEAALREVERLARAGQAAMRGGRRP